jgi:DNA-binding HxlR family transcriptional regulator
VNECIVQNLFEPFSTNYASNILTDRLELFEREELITKRPDPDYKQKYIYRLTEKGIDLLPSLVALSAWSIKFGLTWKNTKRPKYGLRQESQNKHG